MNESVLPHSREITVRNKLARQLEALWRRGERPDVREFLQSAGALTPADVVEVLCVDQWQRWHQGERLPAETYLQMHPALSTVPEEAFDLVYGEFLLREELEGPPKLEEFVQRFPQYSLQLERQCKINRALEAGPSSEKAGVITAIAPPKKAQEKEPFPKQSTTPDWPTIPGYTIVGALGQGGMGQVYKAIHQRLNRVVAIKVIRKEHISQNPKVVQRFQREARAIAQLSHPNIVIVYDFDQVGETCFMAMEFVEGIDFHRLVHEFGPLPIEVACDYIRQASHGLQHAFERGMVHRDVKPSNLLVASPPKMKPGLSGIRPIPFKNPSPIPPPVDPSAASGRKFSSLKDLEGGVVKILDLGLALLIETEVTEGSQWTKEGTLMGTPDYIAPEQAMDSHSVDIRADLYSLGCTFYFLLTGHAPFEEYPNILNKLVMHKTAEPRALEELRPGVPLEVQKIVRQLMAKNPDDRFQTPADLAEALTASPLGKKPTLSRLEPAPGQKPPSSLVVDHPLSPMPALEPASHPISPLKAADFPPRPVAKEVPELPPGVEAAKKLLELKAHPSWVMALAFSPDRNLLASGAVHNLVRVWQLSSSGAKEKAVLKTNLAEVHSLAFSPDNRTLVAGSGGLDGLMWIWNLSGPSPITKGMFQAHQASVDALAFSADGSLLASGGSDRTIRLWDLTAVEPREWAVFKGHTDQVKALAFAPDNKIVASGSLDGTVRFWRKGKMWSKDQIGILEGDWGQVQSVAFSPDGNALAFGTIDQTVRLWKLSETRSQDVEVFPGHVGVVRLVHFSPDGKTLTSVCDGGRVILWDIASGAKAREWMLPRIRICSVAFTLDARYLATGTSDGSIIVFRLYPKKAHQ